MKRYKFVGVVLLLLLFTSCVRFAEERMMLSTSPLTVVEAREYFETEAAISTMYEGEILSPGDYTPQWDKAKISFNDSIACVDVPIIPTYRHRVVRSEFTRGRAVAYAVDVIQKITIVKSLRTDTKKAYIMSIIPTKSYANQCIDGLAETILSAGSRKQFYGLLLYHDGIDFQSISSYRNGNEMYDYVVQGPDDTKINFANYVKLRTELSLMRYRRYSLISGRVTEDDPFNPPPYEDPDQEELGDGPGSDPYIDPETYLLVSPSESPEEVVADLLNRMADSEFKTYINNSDITFATTDLTKTMALEVVDSGNGSYTTSRILYNCDYFNNTKAYSQMHMVMYMYLMSYMLEQNLPTNWAQLSRIEDNNNDHNRGLSSRPQNPGRWYLCLSSIYPSQLEYDFFNIMPFAGFQAHDFVINMIPISDLCEYAVFIDRIVQYGTADIN